VQQVKVRVQFNVEQAWSVQHLSYRVLKAVDMCTADPMDIPTNRSESSEHSQGNGSSDANGSELEVCIRLDLEDLASSNVATPVWPAWGAKQPQYAKCRVELCSPAKKLYCSVKTADSERNKIDILMPEGACSAEELNREAASGVLFVVLPTRQRNRQCSRYQIEQWEVSRSAGSPCIEKENLIFKSSPIR
jgi:hypothetical protein